MATQMNFELRREDAYMENIKERKLKNKIHYKYL